MARRTPRHDYQDPVYYGSVVVGVLVVMLDVFLGSALPSSLCRVMPSALLCGQAISMLVARALESKKEVDSRHAEHMVVEKE